VLTKSRIRGQKRPCVSHVAPSGVRVVRFPLEFNGLWSHESNAAHSGLIVANFTFPATRNLSRHSGWHSLFAAAQ